MKRAFLCILLFLPFLIQAQVKLDNGKRLVSKNNLVVLDVIEATAVNKLVVFVDNGDAKRYKIRDRNGKNMKFFSVIQVIQFMESRGWEYVETMSSWGKVVNVTVETTYLKLLFKAAEDTPD
jgi:hypothetical protein